MTRALDGVWPDALTLSQEYGLPVFPLAAGAKVPAIATRNGGHGCLDATTHAEQVAAWADRFPRANFGIATGGRLRLYVLDFDRLDALAAFTERYGERPRTVTATTPKPGRHEYYVAPPSVPLGNTASKLLSGIDTRGTNGYVVAPPSRLADGRGYTWADGCSPADVAIAPLPETIARALMPALVPAVTALPTRTVNHDRVASLASRVAGYIRALPSLRDGEGRNQTAYRLAAKVYHDWNGSRADAETACDVWNARNFEPLSATKLAEIIDSAARHGGRAHAA